MSDTRLKVTVDDYPGLYASLSAVATQLVTAANAVDHLIDDSRASVIPARFQWFGRTPDREVNRRAAGGPRSDPRRR
ncbi:hypothetical protein [Herbidospora cretacea]|uniref:hypothetical protein n=1 Tax=Herbidospora cretacea TaxID=28444 RepID=UPI0004C459A1|nr:hypothetical protein [Herbidospora cretacea]